MRSRETKVALVVLGLALGMVCLGLAVAITPTGGFAVAQVQKVEKAGSEAAEAREDDEEGQETEITWDQLPDVVKQTVLKESASHKIKDVEESTRDGRKVYEVDWIAEGNEVEIRVAPDGQLLGKAKEEAEDDEDREGKDEPRHAEDRQSGAFTESFGLEHCTFASTGRNDFFILEPGYRLTLEHGDGDRAEKLEVTVLDETRKIGDVETRVVEERETVGGELKEVSRNFFAICKENSSVFYFGEETDEYKGGTATRAGDSWSADAAGAKPGLIMPGLALLGARYYQELAPGVAMDRAEIASLDATLETPSGRFEHCLKTKESSAVERGEQEYKIYAPGIGLIQDEDLLLTQHGFINK